MPDTRKVSTEDILGRLSEGSRVQHCWQIVFELFIACLRGTKILLLLAAFFSLPGYAAGALQCDFVPDEFVNFETGFLVEPSIHCKETWYKYYTFYDVEQEKVVAKKNSAYKDMTKPHKEMCKHEYEICIKHAKLEKGENFKDKLAQLRDGAADAVYYKNKLGEVRKSYEAARNSTDGKYANTNEYYEWTSKSSEYSNFIYYYEQAINEIILTSDYLLEAFDDQAQEAINAVVISNENGVIKLKVDKTFPPGSGYYDVHLEINAVHDQEGERSDFIWPYGRNSYFYSIFTRVPPPIVFDSDSRPMSIESFDWDQFCYSTPNCKYTTALAIATMLLSSNLPAEDAKALETTLQEVKEQKDPLKTEDSIGRILNIGLKVLKVGWRPAAPWINLLEWNTCSNLCPPPFPPADVSTFVSSLSEEELVLQFQLAEEAIQKLYQFNSPPYTDIAIANLRAFQSQLKAQLRFVRETKAYFANKNAHAPAGGNHDKADAPNGMEKPGKPDHEPVKAEGGDKAGQGDKPDAEKPDEGKPDKGNDKPDKEKEKPDKPVVIHGPG
ncbi:hypothetical protein [Rhizobium sp. BK418]|uniref:hypothetical protein n=1 Tax=Rhizobium sp. BK418 TaxID=2512120 RepID=UPI00104F1817|nr:hypothetical protein [Rhizobium sp. BK418]TCS06956.1 hypothetical protein EV281_102566 [Rhizobium sp. BK418]